MIFRKTEREVSLITRKTWRNQIILDYFFSTFSTWIANLGVVPWLRLAAFLFCPAFCVFLALFIFDILVFETITMLLFQQLSYIFSNRPLVLSINHTCVKILFVFLLHCFTLSSQASINKINLVPDAFHTIKLNENSQYSVSNPKVIKTKIIEKQNILIIKALTPGVSDLLIISNKKIEKYRFKVVSKSRKNKDIRKITAMEQYSELKARKLKYESTTRYYLTKKLKTKIKQEVYLVLLKQGLNNFNCNFLSINLLCYYEKGVPIERSVKSLLKSLYFIKLIPISPNRDKNYEISFKLILFEKTDSKSIRVGIHNFTDNLNSIFKNGLSKILETNQQLLSQEKLTIRSLADEKLLLKAHTTGEISFGSKMRYNETTIKGDKTYLTKKWLFSGIKLSLSPYSENGTLYLKLKSSFSRPVGIENQTTNHQVSISPLKLNHASKIFDISYMATQDINDSLPLFSSIPIVKALFSATQNQVVHKKIIGVISIKEI